MFFPDTKISIDIAGSYPPVVPTAPPAEPTLVYPTAYAAAAYCPPIMLKTIPHYIHGETLKLLTKADDMASAILYGKASDHSSHTVHYPVAPVVAPTYHSDFSDRSWKMFNNETHVHHHYHGNDANNQKQQDDTGTRVLVGVIGLIAAGIAAFCIGKAMAEDENAQEENMNLEVLKGRWNNNRDYYAYDYQSDVDQIVLKADALSQREQASRAHKVALLVFTFIGGGLGVAGAITGSHIVMAVAAAIGACVIVAGLFKAGYACFSTRDQKDAQAIENGLDQLRLKRVLLT